MWEQVAHHGAKFRVSDWTLDVAAVDGCLKLTAANDHGATLSGEIQLADMRLPPINESFLRGDELHLVLPQTDGCQVGLELAMLIIEADSQQFVLETVIALQTQQLDLHPRIVLSTSSTQASSDRWQLSPLGSSRWYDASEVDEAKALQLSVLVDPRDRYSIDESQAGHQRLSFFGDFMEKGVIRKVQPWWVWSQAEVAKSARQQLASELSARPLPLAT